MNSSCDQRAVDGNVFVVERDHVTIIRDNILSVMFTLRRLPTLIVTQFCLALKGLICRKSEWSVMNSYRGSAGQEV